MPGPGNMAVTEENTLFLTRQHPVVLFVPALFCILAFILLAALPVYTKRYWLFAFSIVPPVCLYIEYLSWRKRLYMLTDKRVIRQGGMFDPSMSATNLSDIISVTVRRGPLATLFRYGSVRIDTSDRRGDATFHFAAKPQEFKNLILNQLSRIERQSS